MKNGSASIDMDLLQLTHTQEVLSSYAVEFRNAYQDNLIRSGRIASGELLNGIEARVIVSSNEYEVQLTLQDYWRYVEEDTKPHWPPKDAILRWIQIKPVIPRPDRNGRIPTTTGLAYLISRKIARFGTEGSHDLERTKTALNDRFRADLEQALALDVSESFVRLVRIEFH